MMSDAPRYAGEPSASEWTPGSVGLLLVSVVAIIFGPAGILLGTFSLFIEPLSLAFGWERAEVVVLVSVFGLAVAVTSPLKGWLIDRWGARRLMLISTALLAPLLMALAIVEQTWQVRVLFLVLGILTPGNMPYGKLLGAWFNRRRGMAYGLLGLGFGLGGPLGLFIGHLSIETWGWRGAWLVYGLLELLVALPLLYWLFREPAGQQEEAARSAELGVSASEAWRTATFWLVLVNQVLCVFVMSGIITHGVPMLVERGLSRAEGATVLAALSLGMTVSQPLMGGLMDRLQTPRVALPFALLALLGMLLFLHGGGLVELWLAVFLIGLGGGGESGTTKYFVARYFGLRRFSVIYGAVQPFTFAVSISFGAWLLGLLYDLTGSYAVAEWTLTVAFLLAALSLLGFRPYPEADPRPWAPLPTESRS
ncbi:permease [Pseudomonas sp. StFLB209]|nr:permease [Pseudomonas sp. StFLB209]